MISELDVGRVEDLLGQEDRVQHEAVHRLPGVAHVGEQLVADRDQRAA